MKTGVDTVTEAVNAENPIADIAVIQRAAAVINNGGLVAFPTETVYGLGADALNPRAAKRIYEAKNRPADNPLIVHIVEMGDLPLVARVIPDNARILAERFWPGPLTMIFEKTPAVPYETSAGLETVAVRMPSNGIARMLIREAGTPIAAPSANTAGKPSPTRASHVVFDLSGKVDMIIDGGASELGMESTIVDVSEGIPRLLRPGSVTLQMLRDTVGEITVDEALLSHSDTAKPRAPGMKYTHYSPIARVIVVTGEVSSVVAKINSLVSSAFCRIGIMATDETAEMYDTKCNPLILSVGSSGKPETIAQNLFKVLRQFDYNGVELVYAESFPEDGVGMAVMNRLWKAAGYTVINA